MQILIRSIGVKLTNDTKQYLRKKVLKYELLIPNSSVVECSFEQKGGPRRDGNKIVHIKTVLAGFKKTIFVKSSATPDFKTSIDLADAKFSKIVKKYIDLKKFDGKRSKYYWSQLKSLPAETVHRLYRKKGV